MFDNKAANAKMRRGEETTPEEMFNIKSESPMLKQAGHAINCIEANHGLLLQELRLWKMAMGSIFPYLVEWLFLLKERNRLGHTCGSILETCIPSIERIATISSRWRFKRKSR